jgi:hypothetical protein
VTEAIVNSLMLLWNRRPMGVLIRASVHVWSGQPCATGPLASSRSSTMNRASLSLGRATGPVHRGPRCIDPECC